jgi:2-polyprenyl-3-methyl-5-hydroxy-6-metoxy-1,4-benzoquinol methylase
MKRIDFNHIDDTMEDLLYHLARYKFVIRLIKKNSQVLEVGCGTGYGANFMAQSVAYVNACELDEATLKTASDRYNRSNLEFTKNPTKESYDVVVCMEVIEHMHRPEGLHLVSHLYDSLKPNGIAFISTPRKVENPSENRKKYHLHEYSYEDLLTAIETRFQQVLIFSQTDEIISTQNKDIAWNYIAICFKGA